MFALVQRYSLVQSSRIPDMDRYRAIMTDTDREYLAAGDEVADSRRYQAISRVRSRIQDELATDVKILAEHNPELLNELREVVCENE